MKDIIQDASKDPLGTMLLDYYEGKKDAFVEVDSPSFEMWKMEGATMFRAYSQMSTLEQEALRLCRGRILDVGAGSGCHTLYLQEQGMSVDALDISPGCIEVMTRQKVNSILHQNLFSLKKRRYDTLLMLMNGLGICGTLDGCNLFLQFARTILSHGGQILAESTNLDFSECDPDTTDEDDAGYPGETEFIMRYKSIVSDPFDWIYVDFDTLETIAAFNGYSCEQISVESSGRYLVRIF